MVSSAALGMGMVMNKNWIKKGYHKFDWKETKQK